MNIKKITESQKSSFKREGFLLIKSFYKFEMIKSLQDDIRSLLCIIMKRFDLENLLDEIEAMPYEMFYTKFVKVCPQAHKVLYDSIKNLPSFLQIVTNLESLSLVRKLLSEQLIGIAARSYGVRIDMPFDREYLTDWHQDFHFHCRSKKGVVLWTPLVDIDFAIGRLQVLPESHQEGVLPLLIERNGKIREGQFTRLANSVKIKGIESLLTKYEVFEVVCQPGDLLIFDYNLIHKSGINNSQSTRFSVQARYFVFDDDWGIKNGWKGSITSNIQYSEIIPEYIEWS